MSSSPTAAAAMRELARRLDEPALVSGRGVGRALVAVMLDDMLSGTAWAADGVADPEDNPNESRTLRSMSYMR